MNNQKQATLTITPGDKFNSYYSEGTFIAIKIVVKITDSSIFWVNEGNETRTPVRESRNTIGRLIEKGMWKKI